MPYDDGYWPDPKMKIRVIELSRIALKIDIVAPRAVPHREPELVCAASVGLIEAGLFIPGMDNIQDGS
ncbi:hypothetical protein QWJ46_00130 [Rhizobium sp. CBN3]|uniref:hypothetical protein n=1 Tax=Rhizobium sp. CBN3 TaxID=3058045 RepID=UPI0026722483|nr:hypothetical protein [Rhizobium sp. CBN3]MDO3431079.1 hypothetical protein [Rhizobium sp. CBN3]